MVLGMVCGFPRRVFLGWHVLCIFPVFAGLDLSRIPWLPKGCTSRRCFWCPLFQGGTARWDVSHPISEGSQSARSGADSSGFGRLPVRGEKVSLRHQGVPWFPAEAGGGEGSILGGFHFSSSSLASVTSAFRIIRPWPEIGCEADYHLGVHPPAFVGGVLLPPLRSIRSRFSGFQRYPISQA